MLGRKSFTREEIANGKAAVDEQMAKYRQVTSAVETGTKVARALDDFEVTLFNSLALTLDRCYVHRLRSVTGTTGSPLNELELIVESLMNNAGVMRGNNVIKYVPDDAVVKIAIGDQIRLTADDFERLADAVFVELDDKYLG
jgi:hypothetical protein